jgi:hypothetical protein
MMLESALGQQAYLGYSLPTDLVDISTRNGKVEELSACSDAFKVSVADPSKEITGTDHVPSASRRYFDRSSSTRD